MREMASQGYSSRQMAAELNIGVEGCRRTLRREQIEVRADHMTKGAKLPNSRRIVDAIVMDAENLTAGIESINFSELDHDDIREWVKSLRQSARAVNAFVRQLESELSTEADCPPAMRLVG